MANDNLTFRLNYYMNPGSLNREVEASGGVGLCRVGKDLAGIVATNPQIDRAYVEEWAGRQGTGELLERLLGEPRS